MLFPLDTGIAICAYLYNLYGFFLHDRNQLRNFIISSSAVLIVAIPKFSTSTFLTFGERKAGKVGPRCIFFTPKDNKASNTITAFCSYQAILYMMGKSLISSRIPLLISLQ